MDLSRIQWRKAGFSANGGDDCVEAGVAGRVVAVRGSRDPGGPALAAAPRAWRVFIERVKCGASDLT